VKQTLLATVLLGGPGKSPETLSRSGKERLSEPDPDFKKAMHASEGQAMAVLLISTDNKTESSFKQERVERTAACRRVRSTREATKTAAAEVLFSPQTSIRPSRRQLQRSGIRSLTAI